jgi:hypothetical protein
VWQELLAENRARLQSQSVSLGGVPLPTFRVSAQAELLAQAIAFSHTYRNVDREQPLVGPIIMAGHQPQLYHPGVWMKNIVASDLASQVGGIAINLVVDSDVIRHAQITVPTGSLVEPIAASVPLDAESPELPFEERKILSRETWDDFPQRVRSCVAPLGLDTMIEDLWQRGSSLATDNLGLRIAQSRRRWEEQFGLSTLEIPQSMICDTESFRRFVLSVLAEIPRWHSAYNDAIRQYRQRHHLRSSSHPAPLLATNDEEYEAPFWIWTTQEPRRRRLFMRRQGNQLLLSDHQHEWRITADKNGVRELAQLRAAGVKIRSRALFTTLYARVALSDVFIHGIGGAKYDEVTDEIIKNVIGIDPPGWIAASATWQLAGGQFAVSGRGETGNPPSPRDFLYHPERFVPAAEQSNPAVRSKQELLSSEPTTPPRAAWRRAIHAANAAMQPLVEEAYTASLQQLAETKHARQRSVILDSREYAFCLFRHQDLAQLREAVRQKVSAAL